MGQGAWAQREGPGACLERRGGAPRVTRESVRLQDPVLPGPVSVHLTKQTVLSHGITRTLPRADKEPQFLERSQ
jgi:hypothetical protein